MKKIFLFLLAIAIPFYGSICPAAEEIQVQIPAQAAKLAYQVITEGKLLVSAKDAEGDPIQGLGVEDITVHLGRKKAKILSVEPLETSEYVPLNIVLVIDNSFSMKQRRAIGPLLAAMDEFLKIVRPIDNIYLVVFDDKKTIQVKKYDLHANGFHSGSMPLLKNFLREAFDSGLTSKTYLYEAMLAGVDIIRRMPEQDQKFLAVFSDGEDLNSDFENNVVASEAMGIKNFEAFCVDYMPGAKKDRFLQSFAEDHNGKIWKATAATELVPIFQEFSTTLLHRYLVSYKVLDPPGGTVTIDPAELNFEMLTLLDGSPVGYKVFFETGKSELPDTYVRYAEKSQTQSFDEVRLTEVMERYYNILNLVGKRLALNPEACIRIIGCNSDTGVEKNNRELSQRRAQAVRQYLLEIWGIDAARMTLEARNLPARSAPDDVLGGRPENQRADIIFESERMQAEATAEFVVESLNTGDLHLTPRIVSGYDIANWQLDILAGDQPIKTLSGEGKLNPFFSFSLNELNLEKLAASGNLKARLAVTDIYGDSYETAANPVPIRVSKKELIHELVGPPRGTVVMKPEKLTIEELTTIDSSPLLNQVFFETGRSEIPDRYVLFANQADTRTFAEDKLKGTMEKYYQVLNIIAKRLRDNPQARIRIVGCNSNRGDEQGKVDLSRSRAEAVRAYLRYIWGTESQRMTVEAGNLPAAASTGSVSEGRQENQRVEIYSDSPEIMDTIKSTYVEEISDAEEIQILPQIQAGYGLDTWKVQLTGDGVPIKSFEGRGDLQPSFPFDLKTIGLSAIGKYENVGAVVEVMDKKGQVHRTFSSSAVDFIKREERVAQRQEYKVLEKYALILFDFDSADIKARNKIVMDRIIARIRQVPTAKVTIVGHTDTIGKEAYNIDLSIRRAKAAYHMILAGGVPENEAIRYSGAGPLEPLYDNSRPEGRALNRTVTVSLEYEQR
jgi:outer membrane protein OmpA-like peptidoglycan-associated protein